MLRRKVSLEDHEPFARLPVRMIALGGGAQLAMHVTGRLDGLRLPLICVPSYARNMTDYADFISTFHHLTDHDWPVILVDLQGRGRSSYRQKANQYSTVKDGADLAALCDALGIEQGIFVGQGHGGQAVMAMAEHRSGLIGGTILIDAGPVTDTPGLARMRDNLQQLTAMRSARQFQATARQVYGLAHPGATNAELDEIAFRVHMLTKRGRARPLYDAALIKLLEDVKFDDVFAPQWPLFDLLHGAPLMLVRTQLTDSLQRATFERMGDRRSDAIQIVVPGQGTPALLTAEDEVGAMADFCASVTKQMRLTAMVAG